MSTEQLFAPALGDVWHLVEPAGGRWWLLRCTGHATCIDESEHDPHAHRAAREGLQSPIELTLCEECLRRLE